MAIIMLIRVYSSSVPYIDRMEGWVYKTDFKTEGFWIIPSSAENPKIMFIPWKSVDYLRELDDAENKSSS